MYQGYNVTLDLNSLICETINDDNQFLRLIRKNSYYEKGKELYALMKVDIDLALNNFIDSKGNIIASKLEANWFPTINSDVFLSHAHFDEKIAITLAGYLYQEFGLTTFIDSFLWGYSLDLLQSIDKEFCKKTNGHFDYNLRNRSTSYVYMMLTMALTKMIDESEVVFFLNTPSSMIPSDVIENSGHTYSPWIYTEISMTRLIRKKEINEHRKTLVKSSQVIMEDYKGLSAKFDINTDHLIELNSAKIIKWLTSYKTRTSIQHDTHALDVLYNIK